MKKKKLIVQFLAQEMAQQLINLETAGSTLGIYAVGNCFCPIQCLKTD